MNPNDLEQHLQCQLPREVPADWRAEILAAAHAAGSRHSALDPRPSWLSALNHLARRIKAKVAQLSAMVWPQPNAWAGLAAVWVVILTLQLTSRDRTEVDEWNTPPPSPEMLMVLRQQKLLLAELVERPEPRAAERPKALPLRPRSDRYGETVAA